MDTAVTLASGLTTDKAICGAIGIAHQTWIDWKHKASEGRAPYTELFRRIEEVKSLKITQMISGIGNDPDWRAKAWLLERMDSSFNLRHRHEHTGANGAPLPAPATGGNIGVTIVVETPVEDDPYTAPKKSE